MLAKQVLTAWEETDSPMPSWEKYKTCRRCSLYGGFLKLQYPKMDGL